MKSYRSFVSVSNAQPNLRMALYGDIRDLTLRNHDGDTDDKVYWKNNLFFT